MKKISRKSFLKLASAAAMSSITAGALAACNSAASSSTAASGDAIYTAGTYTGTATGIGEVKVTMTFSETAITEVKVDTANETLELAVNSAEDFQTMLMDAQSAEIDGVSGATVTSNAVKEAAANCIQQAIGLTGVNASTMQTSLIQAIRNGASIDPSIIPAATVSEIASFNTTFFGLDICDIAGFALTPLAIFPAIATVTMFLSYFITQKLSGMDAQMQGSMKIMMLVCNLMFVTFCFNAPIGFSFYYSVSNIWQIGQSFVTYKIYSPEKFKKQYEEELAAKRAEKKKKRSLTVEENGKTVTKEVSLADANKIRLELARKREAELHKDERTTPLNTEQ